MPTHAPLRCTADCEDGIVYVGDCDVHPGRGGACRCPDSYCYGDECPECDGRGVQRCTHDGEDAVALDPENYPVCHRCLEEEGRDGEPGASRPDLTPGTSGEATRRCVLRIHSTPENATTKRADAPAKKPGVFAR